MAAESGGAFEEFFYPSRDGLRLAGRDYGRELVGRIPVVCLPGLTRTTRDFDSLARLLSDRGAASRRVVAFDYRGRGASAWDPSGAGYNPAIELQDVLDGMEARGIVRAAIIGTSRGGILAMMMGSVRREAIAAVVLNDIGSRIETVGLLRIQSYVGKGRAPSDWLDAARQSAEQFWNAFPAYRDTDWADFARLAFRDEAGRPAYDYDPALAHGLAAITPETPAIDLSPAFASLAGLPVLVIRGGESELLSRETVAAMALAHPGLETIEAPGEGHPPMLRGALNSAIALFLDRVA